MDWRLCLTALIHLGFAHSLPLNSKELEVTEPQLSPKNLQLGLQHSFHQNLENSEKLLHNIHSRLHTLRDSLTFMKQKPENSALRHLAILKEKLENSTLQHLNTLKNLKNSTLQNVLNLKEKLENSTLQYKKIFPFNILKDFVNTPNSEVYGSLPFKKTPFESLLTANNNNKQAVTKTNFSEETHFMTSNSNQLLNFNNLISSEPNFYVVKINDTQGKNESMENFNSIKQTSLPSENKTQQNSVKDNYQTMINNTLPLNIPATASQENNSSVIDISHSALSSTASENILSHTSTDVETSTHKQETANVNIPNENIFQKTNSSNPELNNSLFNSSKNPLLEESVNTDTSIISESVAIIINNKKDANNFTTEFPIIFPEELDSIKRKNIAGNFKDIAVSPPPLSQEKEQNQIDIRFGISFSNRNTNGNLEESLTNNRLVKNTKRSADFFLFPVENNTNNTNQMEVIEPVSKDVIQHDILKADKNKVENQSFTPSTLVLLNSNKNETDLNSYETSLRKMNTSGSHTIKSNVKNVKLIEFIVNNMAEFKHNARSPVSCENCRQSFEQISRNVALDQQNIRNENKSNADHNLATWVHNVTVEGIEAQNSINNSEQLSNRNSTNIKRDLEEVTLINLNDNMKTERTTQAENEESNVSTVLMKLDQIISEQTSSEAEHLSLSQINNDFLINETMKEIENQREIMNLTKTLSTNRTSIEKLLHVIRKSYANNKFSETELRSIRTLLKRLLILFGEEKTYLKMLKSAISISKNRIQLLRTRNESLGTDTTNLKGDTRLINKREVKHKEFRSRKARHDKNHPTIDIVRKINVSEAEAALLALQDFTNYQQDDSFSSEASDYYDDSDDDYNEGSYENEDLYSAMARDEDYYDSSDEATFDELISLASIHKARKQKLQENFVSHPVTKNPSEMPKT